VTPLLYDLAIGVRLQFYFLQPGRLVLPNNSCYCGFSVWQDNRFSDAADAAHLCGVWVSFVIWPGARSLDRRAWRKNRLPVSGHQCPDVLHELGWWCLLS
jgi:hypothetical protein